MLAPVILRALAAALGVLLAAGSAAAQDRPFAGRILDARAGTGVAGATVSVAGLPGSATADHEGRFTWSPPPPVPFTVIVVLPGGVLANPVTVDRIDGASTDIVVTPLAGESLTVLGAAPSVQVAPATASTLLSARHIERRSPETLLQAIETIPGVAKTSEGHAAVPAVRGLARGRTLLLIDGARVSSERRVGPSASFADPGAFDRIDVARGPGSVAYGSDALGGVVSVQTRRAEPGSPLRVRAGLTLGAGVPERRASAEVSKGWASGGAIVRVHDRHADEWDAPGGRGDVRDSGWSDRGVSARVDQEIGGGVLSAGFQSDFARDVGRPRSNSDVVRFYYPFDDAHRVTASYERANAGGFQQLALTGFFGASRQRTDQDRYATAAAGRRIERADVSAKDFHVKVHAARAAGPARVELGVDVNGRYDLQGVDMERSFGPDGAFVGETRYVSVDGARRTDAGAYAQSQLGIAARTFLSAGLRVDRITSHNSGGYFGDRSTAAAAVSGFGAATVGPFSGVTFTAQASRGFRDATLSDRYYRGPSGRGFLTGNPALDPETSLQFDGAVRYAVRRTQLALYLYHYRIDDLIERYSPEPDAFFLRNRGRARLHGFEVEARSELGRGIALDFGVALGRGTAADDGAALDDVAADTVSVLVRKDFGQRAFAQARGALVAADDRPGPSEVRTPGAAIVDVSSGYTLTRSVELRATVRNLLDRAYYASPDPRWVHAPGRSASVTLAFQY